MDNWDRFTEPKLPPKEAFYSKLSDAHISDEDYRPCAEGLESLWVQDPGRIQRPVLPDRRVASGRCLRDVPEVVPPPVRPGPSSLLYQPGPFVGRLAQEELELLTDYDQHLFIDKGMRGGISMASKRYAKANNPLVEGYDPEKPNIHILYLDANNLYGWAMSQYLPTSGFRWVDDCQQLAKTIAEHPADGPEGFWEGLRFVIVALPGLFSYFFLHT